MIACGLARQQRSYIKNGGNKKIFHDDAARERKKSKQKVREKYRNEQRDKNKIEKAKKRKM